MSAAKICIRILCFFFLNFMFIEKVHLSGQNVVDLEAPKFVNLISSTINITCLKSNSWNNLEAGAIQSPNYPLPYPNRENCIYVIRAPLNKKVVITGVQQFITDSSKGYILIRDGQDQSYPLLGKFSGFINKLPTLSSSSRYMFIQFISENSGVRGSFKIFYEFISKKIIQTTTSTTKRSTTTTRSSTTKHLVTTKTSTRNSVTSANLLSIVFNHTYFTQIMKTTTPNKNILMVWTFPQYGYLTSSINTLSNGDVVAGIGLVNQEENLYYYYITIFNMTNGSIKKSLKVDGIPIYEIIQLSNGYLASASYQTIKIWNNNYQLVQNISAHDLEVSIIRLLQNGNLLSASRDNSIKIWTVPNLSLIQTFYIHSNTITALIELSNGFVASSSWDYSVKIWNPNNGNVKLSITGVFGYAPLSLANLSNGNLAIGSWQKILIYDIYNGYLLNDWPQPNEMIPSLLSLPNGNFLAGSNDGSSYLIKCINTLDGSINKTITGLDSQPDYMINLLNGNSAYATNIGNKISIFKF